MISLEQKSTKNNKILKKKQRCSLVRCEEHKRGKEAHTGSGRSKACVSVGWQGHHTGVIISSFNLNIAPTMSYGVLECDIVMLQNYMFLIL